MICPLYSLRTVNNFTYFLNASLLQHFYVHCEFHCAIAKPSRSFWFTEHSAVHVCCIDVKRSQGSLQNTLYMYIIYILWWCSSGLVSWRLLRVYPEQNKLARKQKWIKALFTHYLLINDQLVFAALLCWVSVSKLYGLARFLYWHWKYWMLIIADLAIEDFANAKDAKGALKRASRGFANMSAGLRIMLTLGTAVPYKQRFQWCKRLCKS